MCEDYTTQDWVKDLFESYGRLGALHRMVRNGDNDENITT